MPAAGADVNLRLFTAEEYCTVILGRSREQSNRAVMSRPAREGMGEEWAGRMDGDPGAHAAGQDRKWANPILEKVAPHKYRRSIRSSKQTNSRPGSVSQSCMYVAGYYRGRASAPCCGDKRDLHPGAG